MQIKVLIIFLNTVPQTWKKHHLKRMAQYYQTECLLMKSKLKILISSTQTNASARAARSHNKGIYHQWAETSRDGRQHGICLLHRLQYLPHFCTVIWETKMQTSGKSHTKKHTARHPVYFQMGSFLLAGLPRVLVLEQSKVPFLGFTLPILI